MSMVDETPINRVTGRPLAKPRSTRSWEAIEAEIAAQRGARCSFAWYIVHCVGTTDVRAIDLLDHLKFTHYYPHVREMRPVPRKRLSHKQRASGIAVMRPQIVPFFPRYIFVRFDMGKDGWREMFKCAGIGGLVCEGELPVWVPDAFIEAIAMREVDGAVPGKTPARLIFEVKEIVRVSHGPFAGHNGIVERIPDKAIENIDPDDRIRVAVSVFGRATPVDLEISQIEKL